MESRINNQITGTPAGVTLDQATANQVIGVLTQTNQELTRKTEDLTARLTRVEGEKQGLMDEKTVLKEENKDLKNELNRLRNRLAVVENASQSQSMPSVRKRVAANPKQVATIQRQTPQPASNRQRLVRDFNKKVALKGDTEKFNKLPARERAAVCYVLATYYGGFVKDAAGQVVGVVDLAKERELLEELKSNDELFRALSAMEHAEIRFLLARYYGGLVRDTAGQVVGRVCFDKERELLEELKAKFHGLSSQQRAVVCWGLARYYSGLVRDTAGQVVGRVDFAKACELLEEVKSNKEGFRALSAQERALLCGRLAGYYGGLVRDTAGQVVGRVDLTKERELLEEIKANNEGFRLLKTNQQSWVNTRLAELNSNSVTQTATTQESSTSTGTKRLSTDDEVEGEKAAEKRARVEASEGSASNNAPVIVKQEPLDYAVASAAFSLVDFSGNGSEKGSKDVVDLG